MELNLVILSLHPEWWPKILSGEKLLEIRKTAPHPVYYPLRVAVYLTAPVCRVVGEFTCPAAQPVRADEKTAEGSCLTVGELEKYAGRRQLRAWEVKKPTEYPKARRISDYGLKRPPQSWCYVKRREAA